MKKCINIIISMVAYFGVYALIDYLFDKNVDWTVAIASSILYAILESILFQVKGKRK